MRVRRVVAWAIVGLLLAPALVVTLARLLDLRFAVALQLQAFTPLAFGVYVAALGLAVGAAAVAWRKRRTLRTPAAPLAVVTALGLLLHGWWFAPLVTGETPGAAADAEPLTVMSANLLGGRGEPQAVVEAVRGRDVDVLVLIEVTQLSVTWLEEVGLAEELPYRAGRPAPPWHVTGTMVFARQPVELVEQVPTTTDSLLAAVGDLRLLAVHPAPPVDAAEWHADHDLLLEAARAHRPDLVVGDFNAVPDHAPMRAYGDLGYRDAEELTNGGFTPTWPTFRAPGLIGLAGVLGPAAHIDHVLVSEDWTALEATHHDLTGSDHRYVVAEIVRRES